MAPLPEGAAARVATGAATEQLELAAAWRLLLACRSTPLESGPLGLDHGGALSRAPGDAWISLDTAAPRAWRPVRARPLSPASVQLFDIYVPLLARPSGESFVLAHLGQSLDGRIATHSGDSQWITGDADLEHGHRLRALFDAVLVGARTVELDDPRLTTRLCEGPNPVRVVIDARRRLPMRHRVFADAGAPTLLLAAAGREGPRVPSGVELIEIQAEPDGSLCARAIVEALTARGLSRIFIEGGGDTVSRFLQQGQLDRLQITVAPVVLGSGQTALNLAPIDTLSEALRLRSASFRLGEDVLVDCEVAVDREA